MSTPVDSMYELEETVVQLRARLAAAERERDWRKYERDEAREALRREKAETERLRGQHRLVLEACEQWDSAEARVNRIWFRARAALQPQRGEAGGEACAGCFDRKVRLWTVHGPNGPEPMREDPCSFCQPAPPARPSPGAALAAAIPPDEEADRVLGELFKQYTPPARAEGCKACECGTPSPLLHDVACPARKE